MSAWQKLTAELDAWAAAGRTATLWWRDDDASDLTPALERLLALHEMSGVPLALAVIPGRAQPTLARRLGQTAGVSVMQHGWRHLNHAPPGRPKAELGAERPPALVLGELQRGQMVLDDLFSRGWLRVLVPPHNRVAPLVAAGLPAAGYSGLSTFNPRRAVPRGLTQVNTHCDIMDWTTTRAFVGEEAALGQVVKHLAARRTGAADPDEPTGLLSHHLAHDEAAWRFVEAFLARTSAHRAAAWQAPEALFRITAMETVRR